MKLRNRKRHNLEIYTPLTFLFIAQLLKQSLTSCCGHFGSTLICQLSISARAGGGGGRKATGNDRWARLVPSEYHRLRENLSSHQLLLLQKSLEPGVNRATRYLCISTNFLWNKRKQHTDKQALLKSTLLTLLSRGEQAMHPLMLHLVQGDKKRKGVANKRAMTFGRHAEW